VIQVHQDRQCLLHEVVRAFPLHLANESDTASIMLELRVIQALLRGVSVLGHWHLC
jgi:hypothetical protein